MNTMREETSGPATADQMIGGVAVEFIEQAILIRRTEEALLALYAEGALNGTVHTCIGQEWSGIAVAATLEEGDWVLSNHRGHGHYIARTDDVEGLIAEVMSCETGVCKGRGGSQHLCRDGFLSNGIVGGMMPVGAGLAFAEKLKRNGKVCIAFVGDGAMAQGTVFEAMNAAGARNLPILFIVEVNGMAQSTETDSVIAGSVNARGEAFGLSCWEDHSDNWADLLSHVSSSVQHVRSGKGPGLHVIRTRRLSAHSKGDDTRPADAVDALINADPLSRLFTSDDPRISALAATADARIAKAIDAARSAPIARSQPTRDSRPSPKLRPAMICEGRQIDRLARGLAEAMAGDDRTVLLGEDIEGPYGGAFKATRDLSLEHSGRVFNTAISEATIIGMATGLALGGYRPIAEIMFGDFLTLGLDQLLNHAAKFEDMYAGRVSVPTVVRTPMGGRRGYGPTHSQSIEKHFLGIPGLTVAAIHSRLDVRSLYASLPKTVTSPTLLIENKASYGQDGAKGQLGGFNYLETDEFFPTLLIQPDGETADLTILCYGGMLPEVETAMQRLFIEHEIMAECVCPVLLDPFDPTPLADSVHRTGRLLVVEEGQMTAGFGAEAIATIVERLGGGVFARTAAAKEAIHASVEAETIQLPGADRIVADALEIYSLNK